MPADVQAPADSSAEVIAQAARRLTDEAKSHMRSVEYHRNRARTLHRQVERLIRECAERGIELDLQIQLPPIPREGGTSGDSSTEP